MLNGTYKYRHVEKDGRRYMDDNPRSPNPRPNLVYEYKGHKSHPNGWAVSFERMQQLEAEGRLAFPKTEGGRIRVKRYLEESKGMPLGNVWDDISPINSQAQERLGYPNAEA
jgi:site-specific DNA-methyltransferase (adenine-specific)